MAPPPKSRRQLLAESIRRFVVAQDRINYFGENSVGRAFMGVIAAVGESGQQALNTLQRRRSLLGGTWETGLADTLEEYGAPRRGASRSMVLACLQPWFTAVTAITNAATSKIEVFDSSHFAVSDSVRIRSTSVLTEIRTVIAITTGTGPNGGNEIEVALLSNSYNPATQNVALLLRKTIATDTVISTSVGVRLQTIAPVTVGDSNPIFNGETTALAVLDKVWCECTTAGARGQFGAFSITGFLVAEPKVRGIFNPESSIGGLDEASASQAKYEAAYFPAIQNVTTQASVLALAKAGNPRVMRTLVVAPTELRTVNVLVLTAQVGPLSSTDRTALTAYMNQRARYNEVFSLADMTLTAVAVQATVTLDGSVTLTDVWRAAASRYATTIDPRTAEYGAAVQRADLITILNTTPGVEDMNSTTFLPATDVAVSSTSLPYFVSLSLRDATTGQTINDVIAVSY